MIDRSEEELRRIIREKICRSRANRGENLHVRTHAMTRQVSSAPAPSVNVYSVVSEDRSEEELRWIIREKIRRSRANRGENLHVRTQAMTRQVSSASASSVNVYSVVSSHFNSLIRAFRITQSIKSGHLSAFC